jgi:hypothetical protein
MKIQKQAWFKQQYIEETERWLTILKQISVHRYPSRTALWKELDERQLLLGMDRIDCHGDPAKIVHQVRRSGWLLLTDRGQDDATA